MRSPSRFATVLLFINVLTSALLINPPALADEEDLEDVSLSDLMNLKVVTASRREEDSATSPATIRVITEREIQDHGYKDLKDIFRDLPGFDLSQNLTGEVRTMAMARGILGENKLMILKDGKKINATTGERLVMGNNMPLFNAKRVEIMYGPGSVLYGADAYAGVVNIITKDFADLKGGLVDFGVGTNDSNLSFKHAAEDLGLMVGAKISDQINTTLSARLFNSDGIDPTGYSDFSSYNLAYSQPVKDYEIYSRTHLGDAELTFYRQDSREPGGPSTSPKLFDFNKNYIWHQIQNKVYLDHVTKGSGWELQSTLGYEDYEIDPQTNFYYTSGPAYKYGRDMAISLEEKLDYRFTDKSTLTTGFLVESVNAFPKGNNLTSAYNRNDQVDQITYPNDTSIPAEYRGQTVSFGNHPYSSAGLFAEGKHRFTDRLIANLGARYDYNSDYYGIFTPNAGVVYLPTSSTTLKLLYGQAYIKPSRYLAYEHWSAGTFGYYPNPGLKPERLKTIQLNAQQRVNSNFVVTVNTFYNFIQDLITPSNTGGAWNYNVNRGSQDTRGGELLLDYQMASSLRANVYYSLLNAHQASGAPMNKVANNKVNAGLTYQISQWSLTPTMRWSDHVYYLDPTQSHGVGQLNDFVVFDFSTRWRTSVKGLDVYAFVLNVLDRKYYTATPFGEGPEQWLMNSAPQPGRTAEVGVSYQF